MTDKRPIVSMSRGRDGLFVEPENAEPGLIEHNCERAVHHFNYADDAGAGNQNSYDPKGNYNCGRCNMANGDECLLLNIRAIDRTAGSCEDWESIRADDAELVLHRKKPSVANYGVAKNGEGFGCKRCPYSKPAIRAASQERTRWCGELAFYVDPNGCCTANGAATISVTVLPYRDEVDQGRIRSKHARKK